jgi:hypothetical protein
MKLGTDEVKENEMGEACSMHGRDKCTHTYCSANQKFFKKNLEKIVVGGNEP